MKALIWIGCFLGYAIIQMIIKDNGIILGGIPSALLFGAAWFIADKLCKICENHRQKKKDKQTQAETALAEAAQLSFFEEVNTNENEDIPKAPEQSKGEKFMAIITSKRIAAVISIVLCAVLYLSFLSAFTTKRDTYICYTTKTGTHYHSATCKYLNTAYETTVYEASRKYKPCESTYCNPCVEQYKTTITDRNYIIPIVISVPISAAIFFLLIYKKKR